jgi:WYL_2, Sm-like SH3 beta-barrel fold
MTLDTFHIIYENATLDDLDLDDRNRELRNLLSKHDCEVTFTKVDGTVRTMPCTLRTEAMPARVVTEEYQTTRLYKPETLSVWCLDKSEWRAFKVANVREIRVLG